MGRIEAAFARLRQQGETALIPFITAGDPDLGRTEELIHTLVEAGADSRTPISTSISSSG
jgi:tryptophan synthase alpha chain